MSYWAGNVPVLRPCGAQLGPELLPNGSSFWPSCAMLDLKLGPIGAKWAQVGLKLGLVGQSWAHVAVASDRSSEFGRYCADTKNTQITTAGEPLFGDLSRGNMTPPAEAASLNGWFTRWHWPLDYHALAPSVRADFLCGIAVCICIYIYMVTYTYLHLFTNIYLYLHMFSFLHINTYLHIFTYVYVCLHICTCDYIYLQICTYIYIYLYMVAY